MKHTTQAELLDLALRHSANPTVNALVLSLCEARTAATSNLDITAAASKTLRNAATGEDGYRVGLDHSDYVACAAKAAAALSRMAGDFMTLAATLQGLGEDVCY